MSFVENPVSQYLLAFVDKEFIHKNTIVKNTKINEISSTSLTFLYHLYQEIKIHYSQIRKNKNKLPENIHIEKLSLHEIQDFLSKKKCKYIYENSMNSSSFFEKDANHIFSLKYTFHINLNDGTNMQQHPKKIITQFFFPMDTEELNKVDYTLLTQYMNDCLRRIYVLLCICYKHSKNGCGNTLAINIFMSNHYKILPDSKEKIIGKIHVNTAYTTSCVENPEINVCREEEWFKCFIHETFHCLGLDFSSYENQSELSKKHIIEIFPLKNIPIYLFETYCEMNAEIINVLFYMFYYFDKDIDGNTQNKMKSFSRIFKERILYEQLFSTFQAVKVLNHYNVNYSDLYKNDMSCVEKRNKYIEETNVLCYYVLKSIYMIFLDDYISWMLNHNGLNHTLQYNNTEETTIRFCGIIKRRYIDPKFILYIRFMENWIRNSKKDKLEHMTLRMSLHEL
jgi:hypothetical protein